MSARASGFPRFAPRLPPTSSRARAVRAVNPSWSAGSRIQADIRKAAADAIAGRKIEGRGAFLWRADAACRVRSRLNTGISGDRIAPEEIAAAVELVLAGGYPFQRQALITETRAVMGYSRTGPILEETIGRVLDDLMARGTLGEASEGIVLRAPPVSIPRQ